MNIEQRLTELGIALSEPTLPKFSYVPMKQTGNLLYSSGNDCRVNGELIYQGTLAGNSR